MKIIGITGGKGGTGKSTIATALAVELGKIYKVLLVDMDVDCPNDHLILNINRTVHKKIYQRIPKFNLKKCHKCGLCGTVCKTHAIVSIKERNPVFMQHQCNGCGACVIKCQFNAISWSKKEIGKRYIGKDYNIDFLSGELKVNEPYSELVVNSVKDLLMKRINKYDYIIIDTAAGTHCDVISALDICNIAFSITEPTPLGSHDLELILKLLKLLDIKNKIILNRSNIGNKKLIESIAKKNKIRIVTEIPYKKEILEAYSGGKPIKDKSIRQIIKKIN